MAEDESDEPMSEDEVISSAQDIVDQLHPLLIVHMRVRGQSDALAEAAVDSARNGNGAARTG